MAADLSGGIATDALSRRFGVRAGRCGLGSVAYLLAAIVMVTGTLSPDPRIAGVLIGVGGALSMFTLAPSWATAIDLGGSHAAVLSATMNTAGQVGGILSQFVAAKLVDRLGDWSLPLHVLSACYLMAAVSWVLIHPSRRDESVRGSA